MGLSALRGGGKRKSVRNVVAWLGCIGIAAIAACSGDATSAQGGAAVFADKCTMCHGPRGKPDAAMVARLGVRDLTAPEFRARVTPALVEHQVRTGSANKLMPSFEGVLTDQQVVDVAAFVSAPAFVGRAHN